MPYAFFILGIILVRAGMKNQTGNLQRLLVSDLTGPNSFFNWIAAILIIGGAGYYPPFQKASRAMLLLIFLVLFLANRGGVFDQFRAAIQTVQAPAPLPESVTGAVETDVGVAPLPEQAEVGPSQNNPGILEGQANTSANAALNRMFGTAVPNAASGVFETLNTLKGMFQ